MKVLINYGANHDEGKLSVPIDELGMTIEKWDKLGYDEQQEIIQGIIDDHNPVYALVVDFEIEE